MQLVTLDQARLQCKADEADDALVTIYANAAERRCSQLAQRNIYPDAAALTTARLTISASMLAANAAYSAAIEAADALEGDADKADAIAMAESDLLAAQLSASFIRDGIVVTDDIIAAVLLITAHWYRNREEVMTGQGATAVQIPEGAANIMADYAKHLGHVA
jgi:hypothetical protein